MSQLSRRSLLAGGLVMGAGMAGVPVSTATGATPATPKRGGTLIAAAESDPVSLDPHTNSNFSAAQGFEHLCESLTGYNEKNQIVPMLARSGRSPTGERRTSSTCVQT